MSNHILITGATGLVGKKLTQVLLKYGHHVTHLGRSAKNTTVPTFVWDVTKKEIDFKALDGVDTIIHLAGASISDKRWTEEWKKEILDSRVNSTRLLAETLKNNAHTVKTFICASAIGYYGGTTTDELFTEESKPGSDFLAYVTQAWEHEADQILVQVPRVVKIRTGVVLSSDGGALEQMAKPIRYFVGSPLASGYQYISWIHIDDLCEIYRKAVEDKDMKGVYNAVAPHPVTNREMTKAIAQVLKRPLIMPSVPAAVLKLILGEMSNLVVLGNNVSSGKVEKKGYVFIFANIQKALKDCLKV